MNREQLKIKAAKLLACLRKPVSRIIEMLLLFAFTVLACIFLLYYSKYLWLIFTYTQVGQAYAVFYEESYRITNDLFSRDIASLTLHLTLTSFVICFIGGALLKFLHVLQYFYSFRGFFGRIIFAGLPLTYLVALYIHYTAISGTWIQLLRLLLFLHCAYFRDASDSPKNLYRDCLTSSPSS